MTQKPSPADVDEFLDTTVVGDDPALSAAREASDAAGLPQIAVSTQQGKFLSLLAGAIKARRILEIGTLGGFSTIWLARGAGPDGRVLTLEYEPKHAEVARANIDRAGVGDRVEVVVGPALETLPTVTQGPFDLVFIDADKENNAAYLDSLGWTYYKLDKLDELEDDPAGKGPATVVVGISRCSMAVSFSVAFHESMK